MSQQIIYRILDANLDRAREALRTIEEWCRFGIEEVSFCDRCKHMRQELAQWHKEEFRLARNTPDDPATGLSQMNLFVLMSKLSSERIWDAYKKPSGF